MIITKKPQLIHQRRGGPGAPGAGFFILIIGAMLIPLAALIGAIVASIANKTTTLIKHRMPEAKVSAGDSLIIMFGEILILGIGAYLVCNAANPPLDTIFVDIVLIQVVLMTGLYGLNRYLNQREKFPELSPEIRFEKEFKEKVNNKTKDKGKVTIRPPRTSQIILLVVMVGLILGLIAYLLTL